MTARILEELLPSEEEVRLYRERGYYISKKIFTNDEIASAIAVHLQDDTNQYREFRYEDDTLASHQNDQLTAYGTGTPDYRNEAVCPVLYRR